MLSPSDHQRQTLRLYGEMLARQERFASRLVLCCGAQSSASGLPAAVSIAGGATLAVDPDAAAVKAVLRQGGVDFVVNTLDEALRVLKNELRKHTPVSVALVAEVGPTLDEMAERGVQPDLLVQMDSEDSAPGWAGVLPRVESLELHTVNGLVQRSPTASQWLAARGWAEHLLQASSAAELRALDVRVLQHLASADGPRLHWVRRIPHYQRPSAEAGRVIWLSESEAAAIAADRP